MERVIRWRLIIEEFNQTITYIKGSKNIVADALSRLQMNDSINLDDKLTADNFTIDIDNSAYPLNYKALHKHQKSDKYLIKNPKLQHQLQIKTFHGGRKHYDLLCTKDHKIYVPVTLQDRIIQWYHTYLLHPGFNRTEETICQHFWWPGMHAQFQSHIKYCDTCQRYKKQHKNMDIHQLKRQKQSHETSYV